MPHNEFIYEAVKISISNIENGGGPFGAVITLGDSIIASAGNSVTKDCDPTAHAEINAIRQAGKYFQSHDLSQCVLYSSCEPCPMCLSAIYWSGIKTVYYANSRIDAEKAGFNDAYIYKELSLPDAQKHIQLIAAPIPEAIKAFQMWKNVDSARRY